jgi:ABC-type dipeptide/oligopeptide/nickel transport system permease component
MYIGFLINMLTGVVGGLNSMDTMDSMPNFSSFFGSFFPMILIGLVVMLLIFLAIKLFQCFHCRRLSWNRCEWKDYDSFEQGERNWHMVGMVFFILQMLSIVFAIALIVFAWNSLMPMINEALMTI